MRVARFKVIGKFTGGGMKPATVSIDRSPAALFSVRPLRRKRVYELPLSAVAEYVVWHVTKVEIRDKKLAKQKARREKSKKT